MSRFVDVVITKQTQAVTQAGFGLALILSTDNSRAYKEYTNLAEMAVDFGTTTKAYKIGQAIFGQTPSVEKVAVFGIAYDAATETPNILTAALSDLILEHNEFYYLLSTEQMDEEITALAQWATANKKLYFATTSNKTLANTLASERAIVLVHNDPTTFAAAAWVGNGAPREAGSFTWTFKTLNGVPVTNFDTTEINAIEAAHGNTYIREGGVAITSNGVTSSGEYIDIIQSQDFIESRMVENVFGLLVRSPKVPFTDQGIALVVAEVEKTLQQAAAQGIVATDADGNPLYNVTAPSAAQISANDKANRKLPGVKWSVTIAGAIEDVTINGSLQI